MPGDLLPAPRLAPTKQEMGSSDWTRLSEDLLRGLVHSINNRVTALSAFTELASIDGETLEIGVLRTEITRLHSVSALVGILATRSDEPEALELRSVLDVALSLHAHHPRMRTVPCSISQSGLVLPVRVPRWAMLRLFLLMVDAAKRAGLTAAQPSVIVRLSGDESFVRAHIASAEPLGEDAASYAAVCGGQLTRGDGEVTLTLPSLLELRRRERM